MKRNPNNHYKVYPELDEGGLPVLRKQFAFFKGFYCLIAVELVKNIPQEKMKNTVNSGAEHNCTLEFLFEDYIVHLEHHLRQVVTY